MAKDLDLTALSDDELTDLRASNSAAIDELRAKNGAIGREVANREVYAAADKLTSSLDDDARKALAQHITNAGSIESGETVAGVG